MRCAGLGDRILARAVVDQGFRIALTFGPLLLQCVDVPDHVDGRGVPWRGVFGLDLSSATRAIEFEDSAEEWIRREGVLVFLRIEDRRVNFAGISVVNQSALFVIPSGIAHIVLADPAEPALGVEIYCKIFGHGDTHDVRYLRVEKCRCDGSGGSGPGYTVSVRIRSPELEISKSQPAGT